MTDAADEKAREILNRGQDYETLRRNIAQAIRDARAEGFKEGYNAAKSEVR